MLAIYLFHLIVIGSLLAWAVNKGKASFTPAFLFTICISYSFYSDFIVRAYDHPLMDELPWIDVVRYQLIILVVYLLGIAYAWHYEVHIMRQRPIRPFAVEQAVSERLLETCGWAIIVLEIVKRLYTTGWSISGAISASLQARGDNPWQAKGNTGDGTFAVSLIFYLLPLAGILFATCLASVQASLLSRCRTLIGLISVVLLTSNHGSRFYLAVPLLYFALRYLYSPVSSLKKITVLASVAGATIILFSILYLYRSEGLGKALDRGDIESQGVVKYHQDDSYYRIMNAAYVTEHSPTRLDAGLFLYTLLVNPIPRYFWSDKPALTSNYYGEYKKAWVTITFMGELIAFFGVIWGSVASLIMMMIFYHLISFATRFVNWPLGTGLYIVFTLYVYLCMRSLLDFTLALPGVAGMLILCYLVRASSRRSTKTSSVGAEARLRVA